MGFEDRRSNDVKSELEGLVLEDVQDSFGDVDEFFVDEFEEKIALGLLSKEVGTGLRCSRAVLKIGQISLKKLAKREFTGRLSKLCGKKALMFLVRKIGLARGAIAVGAMLIDGPLPIGDALALVFTLWTAKDVYDLASVMWEGYRLNEELDLRLTNPVLEIEILRPFSLKEKYSKDDLSDVEMSLLFEELIGESDVQIKVCRKMGCEHWHIVGGEIDSLVLYDSSGVRVAGINESDLQKVENAWVEIDKIESSTESNDDYVQSNPGAFVMPAGWK